MRVLEHRGKKAHARPSAATERGVASTARAVVERECAERIAEGEFALCSQKHSELGLGHARGRAGERGRAAHLMPFLGKSTRTVDHCPERT